MSFEVVKADLRQLYEIQADDPEARLTNADVQRWSALLGVSRAELYDLIAMYLARGFYNAELTFDFCDPIVNDIHGVITISDEERPDLFWKVYLAFDAGEYCHQGDDQQQDPVELYTRPLVAEIVSGSS